MRLYKQGIRLRYTHPTQFSESGDLCSVVGQTRRDALALTSCWPDGRSIRHAALLATFAGKVAR